MLLLLACIASFALAGMYPDADEVETLERLTIRVWRWEHKPLQELVDPLLIQVRDLLAVQLLPDRVSNNVCSLA